MYMMLVPTGSVCRSCYCQRWQRMILPQSVKAPEEHRGFSRNAQYDPMTASVFAAIHSKRCTSQLLFLVCPEPVSCIWRYHKCLVDFIQYKLFKIKCYVLLSVMIPWRNSGVQYLNTSSVFSTDLVQAYHLNCY